ncbi:MAG: helix-turn-helix domain-containing protein [Macromonas bipunctata]|nr:helix-turn-helix domain-containing protein [Macromonas bipunctata]
MADQQLNTTAPSGRVGFINFDLVGAALLHTRLEKSCRWVLVALCSYANLTQHRAWPSVASLARRAGCSERTAQSRLRQLERAGYIHAIHNDQHSTVAYQIAADKLLHELSGSTSAAPPCAPAKTAPPGAKTVAQGVQTPHPKKEERQEKIEQRKEGDARAFAPLADTAARTPEPTFPVLASEGLPAAVPCPAPVAVVVATASAEATPALPSGTVERLNAQRAGNGKGALTPRDLAQLATEAAQAGLTPQDAAQWVLAKPQRNFFKAAFYARPAVATPTPVAQRPPQTATPQAPAPAGAGAAAPVAPITLSAEAQAEQDRAAQERRAHVDQLLASLPATLQPTPGAARSHHAQTAPPARNTRWASHALELFATGKTVSHYRLKVACEVLGIDLRALLRQRAASTAT